MQSFVDIGYGPIHWHVFSQNESAPTIHLAPANGIVAGSYASFFEQFDNQYHISGMDSRGSWPGQSPPPKRFPWDAHADDLIAAIEKQYSKPIIGMGHSLGGTVLAMAACKRPQLFSKLVMIEPASTPNRLSDLFYRRLPQWLSFSLFDFIKGTHQRRRVWDSREQFFNNYQGHPTFKRFTDRALDDYTKHGLRERADGKFELVFDPHWESLIFRNVEFTWKYIKQLTHPTLLLKAQHTTLYRQDYFDAQCARLNSNVTAATLPDTYHLMTHERPELVSTEICNWLRS